jgi:uncharacterized delta-60 repeat protein
MGQFTYDGRSDTNFTAATNGSRLVLLSTGKLLTSASDGQHSFLVRLNEDGSIDPSYHSEVLDAAPQDLAQDAVGRMYVAELIGGGGTNDPVFAVVRLNQDGSLDKSFHANGGALDHRAAMLRIAVQQDGRVLVASAFLTDTQQPSPIGVIRLNPDGSADPSFAPEGPAIDLAYASIDALAIQPDGKVIVAGNFSQFGVVSVGSIVRLNRDGTMDFTFNPGTGARNGSQDDDLCGNCSSAEHIMQAALQPDGKIIIAGTFDTFDGKKRLSVARLNSDGSLDPTFDMGQGLLSNGELASVEALVIESNGDILLGGSFDSAQGVAVNGFVRLNGGFNGGIITHWNRDSATLTLATRPGQSHVLELSPDLVKWSPVSTNAAMTPLLDFQDVRRPAAPNQFYRARLVQP